MTFYLPDTYYDPPEPHECDNPECEGDECEELARQALEDAAIDRADSIRKGEW